MNICSADSGVPDTHLNSDAEAMLIDLLRDLGCDVSWLEHEEDVRLPADVAALYAARIAASTGTLAIALRPDASFYSGSSKRLLVHGHSVAPEEHVEPLSSAPETESWLRAAQETLSTGHVVIGRDG
jgi:hypothetical protein